MSSFFKKILNNEQNSYRYYTGIALISIVGLILILNIKFLAWLSLGLCYILALKESMKLYKIDSKPYLYVISIAIWLISYSNNPSIYISLVFIIIIASYNVYNQINNNDLMIIIYPTIPFLCIFDIYKFFGINAIVWLIITVAVADIAAYFGGMLFGKSQLSVVSPKKTLEGALIGVVFAVIIGSIIGVGTKGFIPSFLITLCIAIASIFGDLYESSLKRSIGVKDSGNILPGHGGILDRIDGLLFAGVVMIFLLNWI